MARHDSRDHRGRWAKTPSGAPIPDESGNGDDSAYEDASFPSADPLGEYDRPWQTVYAEPAHNPALGAWQRPLPQRRQISVNARTGEQLDNDITAVRGAERLIGGSRTNAHLAAAAGDPFAQNLMGPAIAGPGGAHRHMGDGHDEPNEAATHTAWPGSSRRMEEPRP